MSSHREAPEISKDPVADSTDVYAFVSPDRPRTVTLIANYIPLQGPAGGPNFYQFGDNVRYAIHIDTHGHGEANITYEFDFKTDLADPDTFLYNTGPITSLASASWSDSRDGKLRALMRSARTQSPTKRRAMYLRPAIVSPFGENADVTPLLPMPVTRALKSSAEVATSHTWAERAVAGDFAEEHVGRVVAPQRRALLGAGRHPDALQWLDRAAVRDPDRPESRAQPGADGGAGPGR